MADEMIYHSCADCIKTRFKPLNPALKSFCIPPEKVMKSMVNAMKDRTAPQEESVTVCDHPESFEKWPEETN